MRKIKFRLYIFVIFKQVFEVSLLTYLILLIVETIKLGFVTYFFDLNILLFVVLISGIIMVLTEVKSDEKITVQTATERLWFYFFKKIGFKEGRDFEWFKIFNEVKAKRMLEKSYKFDLSDWILNLRDSYINDWVQKNFKGHYGFRHFWVKEREWHYFKSLFGKNKISSKDFQFMVFVSLGGGFLVFYKTVELGKISFVISALAIFIIFLLSYLILTEQE